MVRRFRTLRARLDPGSARFNRWYCPDPECDGEPHEGFHWCDHPIASDAHTWECRHCRADQRPPQAFVSGEARGWMVQAGRGFGKTRAAAEWLADRALCTPNSAWAIVAPDFDVVRDTCIEGESGLLQTLGWLRADDRYDKTRLRLRLDNGTVIRSYSAESPRKARGPNLYGAWLEEIAQWTYREMWDNLFPAIRRGLAQYVITTTPAPVPLVREFATRDDGSVIVTRGSTFENEKNLAPHQVAELRRRWAGTRREKQELFGELLEDVAGALWQSATLESSRVELVG